MEYNPPFFRRPEAWMRAQRPFMDAVVASVLLLGASWGCARGPYKELRDPDPAVRSNAAMSLGESKTKEAVPAIVAALNDPEETVRVDLIRALGQIGDPKAVPAIVPFAADPLSGVRLAACQALGQLGDPRGVPALEAALSDEDETLRVAAARALGKIPGPESMDVLLRVALSDESESVRSHVLIVVGERRERDAVPRLESALAAESERVRANAAQALGVVGDRSSLPILFRALNDPFYKVRCLSAHAIAKLAPDDPAAREELVKRLAVETHGMARVDLAWAVGTAGDPSHLDVVRTLLFQGQPEDVRAEAAIALGALGGSSDVPILERALSDKKGLVRNRAAEAIEKIKGSNLS